jgi:hypothetical protein
MAGTVLGALAVVLPSSASAATPLVPPAVPPAGHAYLGAWVQPNGPGPYVGSTRVETELSELGEFQAELGRPPGMVHVYQAWDQPASNSLLNAISSTGAIPIVDWSCLSGAGANGTTHAIANGKFDTQISNFAKQLKAYGKPVFLRWLWEQNLSTGSTYTTCERVGTTVNQAVDGPEYVRAWRRIYNIFKGTGANSVGATNVAFVWNPGIGGDIDPAFIQAFWPGYQYVNWVGMDGYSRPTSQQKGCIPKNPTFAQVFASTACTNLYSLLVGTQFAGSDPNGTLPMMIGETGASNNTASPNHQADYFTGATDGILNDFTNNEFSDVRALNYYDGINPNAADGGTWTLQPQSFSPGGNPPSGFAAFAKLAGSPNFSFLDPG